MEKLFQFNRWFVLFCGLLVLTFTILQAVSYSRLVEEAKLTAQDVFTWRWTSCGLRSSAVITDTRILRKSDTDAVVRVKGRQTLLWENSRRSPGLTDTSACGTVLTFYKKGGRWYLGKVEL